MDWCEKLANAIVVQAARNYFDLCAGFHIANADGKLTIEEIESFFRSGWYKILTDADPDYILTYIKEEASKMVLEYTVSKQRGSRMYCVHRVGEAESLSPLYHSKREALHKAAEMQRLNYDTYMRIRRRDGVKCD